MKILSVGCLNLNSLRGTHRLDFRKGALADCGLFAITGPTGAGKTTLLDAITLALYGRTPRQEKNGAALMSHGTGECWAEVVFEVERRPDGQPGPPQRYLARWHQRRARSRADGTLQDAGMEVSSQPDARLLTQKKREAEAALVTLTGLTYDQFTRSVLLAQGGFAQFLKASANDRAELLERMTGTDHYRTLSMASFQAWKAEQEKEQTLRAQLGVVTLLPPDERTELEAALAATETAVLTAQAEEQTLTAAVRWHETLTRLATDLAATTARLTDAQAAQTGFAPDLARLTRHERVAPFAPAWAGIQDAATRADVQARELTALDEKLTHLTAAETAAHAQLQTAEAAVREQQTAVSEVEPILEAAKNEFVALAELRKQVEELHDHYAALTRQLAQAETTVANVERRSADERAEFERLTHWLTHHRADVGIPTALTELTQLLADRQQGLDMHQRVSKQHSTAVAEQQKATADAARYQTRLQELAALSAQATADLAHTIETQAGLRSVTVERLATAQQKLTTAQNRLREKTAEWEFRQRVASLAEHRHALQPGEACPLCGSAEHVFAALAPDISADTLSKLKADCDEHATRADQWQQQTQRLEQVLVALGEAPATDAAPRLPDPTTPTPDLLTRAQAIAGPLQTLPVQLRQYAAETEQATALAATATARAQEHAQVAAALVGELQEWLAAGRAGRDAINSIATTWQVSFLESAPDGLPTALRTRLTDFEANQARHRDLEKAVAAHDISLTQARHDRDRLTEEARIQQVRWQERAEDLKARTVANARHYVNFATPTDALAFRRAKLRAAEQFATERTDAYTLTVQARQMGAADRQSKDHEHQRTRADHAARLAALHTEWQAAGLGPDGDPTALADWLLPEAVRTHLDAERQRRQQAVASATEQLARLRAEQQAEQARALTPDDAPTTAARHTTARQHGDALLDTRAQQRARLAHDDTNRLAHAERAVALTAQTAETLRWKELTDLIGSREGDKFARFAQSLTLARLTQLANQHLQYLCARYRLRRHPDTDRPLDLLVVDRYQADSTREVSTLSGGESFLVSLALALGLSELASNTARLDSLFIDEGFGTLDAETLDIALDALENLQARGKTIGIISHVESLKDRIPVQVVVEKGASGFSTLRVLPEMKEGVREAVEAVAK